MAAAYSSASHTSHAHAPTHTPIEHESDDSWHQHDLAQEGMPQNEHVAVASAPILFGSFVVISATTAIFIIIVVLYYFGSIQNVNGLAARQEKAATERLAAEALTVRSEADAQLAAFGWVDPASDTVSVPMDLAYQRVMKKYEQPAAKR
jgi:hypothetical protein